MATMIEYLQQISEFVVGSPGLEIGAATEEKLEITQVTDGKVLTLFPEQIDEIISRIDSGDKPFLQVNFVGGKKLLLTEQLIGFKPAFTMDLDMNRLPRVVTTPDLISVVEAIEESMNTEGVHPEEINVLRKVFDAVIQGGEDIGFDLRSERAWINMLANTSREHSA